MSPTDLTSHSTKLIMADIKSMIIAQGFTFNEDLSETDNGKSKNKTFKMPIPELSRDDSTNRQNITISGRFSVELFHNAQNSTAATADRIVDDVENIAFDIEIFNAADPTKGKPLVKTSEFEESSSQASKVGNDNVIKTTLIFAIKYVIRNPNA